MYSLTPDWLDYLFIAVSLLSIYLYYILNNKPKKLILVILIYAIAQSIIASTGIYDHPEAFPPRPTFIMLPMVLFMIYGLLPKQIEWTLKNRNHEWSPIIHVVRIPIELALFVLYLYHTVPELMTFEGRNFDILAGITAPLVVLLTLNKFLKRRGLLLWNFICLGLVLFIVMNAVFSLETPFQQFAFDQPNKAVLHFPYVLLPALVVPLVIYTHLTDIIKLLKDERK